MKIGKSARNFAQISTLYQEFEFFIALALFVLSWFVMSVVVFLRKDFGRTYVGWINLFFGYTAIGFFVALGNLSQQGSRTIIGIFYLGFVVLSIYHKVLAERKRKAGIKWHTEYSGTPLIKLPVSRETMNKWVEPGVIFAAALLMKLIHSYALESWLVISAIGLLLHEHISYNRQEEQLDSLINAQIEAEHWQDAMKGRPAEQTQGFVIASSTVDLLRKAPDVRDVFANLAPDIKGMLDHDKERAA